MKKPIQGLVCAVFYAVLYLLMHWLTASMPFLPSSTATVIANLLAVALGVAVARGFGERPLRPTRAVKRRAFADSLLLGAGAAAVVLLLMTYLPIPSEWLSRYTGSTGDVTARSWMSWVSALVVAPIAEEIVFRGLIYRSLKKAIYAVPSALAVSLLFGWIHGDPVWMVYTFLLGLLTVWVMERTGTVWAAVACHAAFNLFGQLPALLPMTPTMDVIYLVVGSSVFVLAFLRMCKK